MQEMEVFHVDYRRYGTTKDAAAELDRGLTTSGRQVSLRTWS